ncbi:MAG TPA: hypothetical protein VF455_13305 [Chryseobacterium sp.]
MNIKNITTFIFAFSFALINAQNIYLSKVEKVNDNADKFFIKINKDISAEYLGQIDVQGFSSDDEEVFSKIYKKAKEIGANAFAYQPFDTVDEIEQPFNPANYRIKLFYITKEEFSKNSQQLYLFSSSEKSQTISINKKDYVLEPRSYLSLTTIRGDIYTISTKKFLGSAIKVSNTEGIPKYFQVSALKVSSNKSGDAGINLKSGDITGIDRSYGDFLRMIYNETK